MSIRIRHSPSRRRARARTLTAVACAALLAAPAAALAQQDASSGGFAAFKPDALFAQAGRASETSTFTLGLVWNWDRRWSIGEHAIVTAYSELSIGHWRADDGGGRAVVTQVGFTPAFRFWPSGHPSRWFVEGAIGVNALTPIYRTREKRFSTAFNFGDHVAVGYRQPGADGWEWSLRLQHFSNAGIDQPNPGENFAQLRLLVPLTRG